MIQPTKIHINLFCGEEGLQILNETLDELEKETVLEFIKRKGKVKRKKVEVIVEG